MEQLPFSRLPGMNALFLDFIEEPDRVREYYPAGDLIPARNIPHRPELCRILRRQNQAFGNSNADALLKELENANCFCVITGQQAGLLTGPLYTIWKALTILRLCQEWRKTGISCVPVFWMATEDHNWHEVLNVNLLNDDYELLQFSLKEHLFLKRQPTGSIPVTHDEVRKILLRVFREFSLPQIKEIYSQGTVAEAFARTLLWLLKDFPVLIVDPSDPELKQLARPFFERFFGRRDQIMQLLSQQNESLRALNYPTQVKMEEDALPLFRIQNGERFYVKLNDPVEDIPVEQLSPSALLRPLFQDFIFPTLAYIGGPAEIAYFAQLHPWYRAMEMEQPRVLSRASITLLPGLTRGFLQSKRLTANEMFMKEEILLDALIRDSRLDLVKKELRHLSDSIDQNLGSIKARAATVEVSLRKAIETAEKKMNYQLQKVERKTLLAVRRQNDLLAQQLRKAKNVVYPDDKLQERCLNVFSFASRLPELIHEVYEKIEPFPKGHQWITI